MWLVKLTKQPTTLAFRSDYFPRKVYYKKEAVELKKEVKRMGGEAIIEKVK